MRFSQYFIDGVHSGRPPFPVDGSFLRPLQSGFRLISSYLWQPVLIMLEGYCVKCKTRKEISNGVEETMKNGRRAIKGRCATCGTVMFKILGGKPVVTAPPAAEANLPQPPDATTPPVPPGPVQ